jgi:hypothetical protein
MKKLVQFAISALVLFVSGGSSVLAQMTTQTVSISPGYSNQTFYDMNNGVVSSVSNLNWDLGFQLRGYTGSILINSKNNVKLYRANKSVSEWNTMLASDTNGVVNNPAFELFNSETSWNAGAFNRTNNSMNPFDLGWGVYDLSTHMITGDSVFFMKLPNGVFKKLQIIDLNGLSFVYTFRWADLDGTNEQTRVLDKANYPGKHFAYYTLTGDSAIDREPLFTDWDLTFTQYVATLPIFPYSYKVAGVLLNDSVFAAKAYPVDTATVALNAVPMQSEINTIGFDWKFFDQPNNAWVISDSLVYFVQDRQGNPWKMIFTGFGGAANGNFIFQQGPAATVGVGESVSMQTLGLYPNPASSQSRLMVNMKDSRNVQLMMADLSGRSVRTMNLDLQAGIQSVDIDLSGLNPGLYTVVLTSGEDRQVSRLVVN